MASVEELNRKFSHVAGIRFCQSEEIYPLVTGSLPLLVVENEAARLLLALNGAHVMSFVPAGKPDLLWMSPKTGMARGIPIRGGIPLCLPWFGPHAEGHPQHGFARISDWRIDSITATDPAVTTIRLSLSDTPESRAMWPHAFAFSLDLRVGQELELRLSVTNLGETPARLEFAFHTYFNVGDVAKTEVLGLENCVYLDRLNADTRHQQQGAVTIPAATTHFFRAVPSVQTIRTPLGTYRTEADFEGCMVWNAGDNDKNMADLGEGNHRFYLCVEPVDALDAAAVLAPGAKYQRTLRLSAL